MVFFENFFISLGSVATQSRCARIFAYVQGGQSDEMGKTLIVAYYYRMVPLMDGECYGHQWHLGLCVLHCISETVIKWNVSLVFRRCCWLRLVDF